MPPTIAKWKGRKGSESTIRTHTHTLPVADAQINF